MLQKLLRIITFILKFSHFYSICHKIDTLCSLLSYWKYLQDIIVQVCINFIAKLVFAKSSILSKFVTNTFSQSNFYTQIVSFLFNLPKNKHLKLSDELVWASAGLLSPDLHQFQCKIIVAKISILSKEFFKMQSRICKANKNGLESHLKC